MKGHILIMLANILFGASMPVFKYLLTADVPPEAITIMRAIFACMMFWLVSFFMPKEKSCRKIYAYFSSALFVEWGSTNGCLSSG